MMILEELSIRKPYSYEHGDGYKGLLKFSDSETKSEVTMPLDARLSQRILEIVSEEITFTAKKIAETLTANCIASTSNQLENKGVDKFPEL